MAHGTFFFHFPTKEHVVAELGQREEVRMAGELDRFLAEPRDLKDVLVEVMRLATLLERRLGTVAVQGHARPLLLADPARAARSWPEHPVIARVVAEFERAGDRGDISTTADVDPANSRRSSSSWASSPC